MINRLTLLFKPTHRCNLNCWYCYNKQFEIKEDTSLSLVEKAAKFASDSAKNINWIWHGGEPLLMPIEFYTEAESMLKRHGIKRVSMQSNGILLNETYIRKFKEWGWNISISFDGISNELSRGHTEEILNALKLQKTLNHSIGIIKVVNQKNLHTLHEDYGYVKPYVNAFDFNLIFPAKDVEAISGNFIEKYLEEYSLLLDIWLKDKDPIMIRNFEQFLGYFLGTGQYLCSYSGYCFKRYMCVDPIGDLYPCDSWFPEEYKYGNIINFNSMSDIKNTDVYLKLENITKERLEYCKKCLVFPFCKGGCGATAIVTTGGNKPNKNLCETKKREIYHFFNTIKNLNPEKVPNPMLKRLMFDAGFRNIKFIKEILEGQI